MTVTEIVRRVGKKSGPYVNPSQAGTTVGQTLSVDGPQSSVSREMKEEEKAEQVRKEVDLGPVRGTSPLGPVCDSQANPFVKEGDGPSDFYLDP